MTNAADVLLDTGWFLIMTVTPVDVPLAPAESVATAAKTWLPSAIFVLSKTIVYGAVVTAGPKLFPSMRNWTDTTLSPGTAVAVAVAAAATPEIVAEAPGAEMDTVGGGVGFLIVTETVGEVALAPDESVAVALKVCLPFVSFVVSSTTVYGATVVERPKSSPSSVNFTLEMDNPASAAAVAKTVTLLPDTVAASVGLVIDTVGGVLVSSEYNRLTGT